jgi:tetratricopeptide (TPR) repeat protein
LAFSFLLAGCGSQTQLNKAKRLEQKGKYEAAWAVYQRIAAQDPESPVAPEALFRAGLMSQRHLNDCYMAGTFYDRVIENYSQSVPWARAAVLQKQNCPDYFPLLNGSEWVEGDSETNGKNARIRTVCKPFPDAKNTLPSEGGVLEKTYFAGDKESSSIELIYKKINDELLELKAFEDAVGKVVLKWPLDVGQEWKTRPVNTTFVYNIQYYKGEIFKRLALVFDGEDMRSQLELELGITIKNPLGSEIEMTPESLKRFGVKQTTQVVADGAKQIKKELPGASEDQCLMAAMCAAGAAEQSIITLNTPNLGNNVHTVVVGDSAFAVGGKKGR